MVKKYQEENKPAEEKVIVTDGDTSVAVINLIANFVNVTINTDSKSDIYIDNEYKGKGSWKGRLPEGAHYVEARKTYHQTTAKNVTLVLGEDVTVTIDAPKPINGHLDVNSNPMRADIYIDGNHYGQTPKIISDLLIGKHEIKLYKQGCAPLIKTIEIEEGETLSLNETLLTGKEITISANKVNKNGCIEYCDREIEIDSLIDEGKDIEKILSIASTDEVLLTSSGSVTEIDYMKQYSANLRKMIMDNSLELAV